MNRHMDLGSMVVAIVTLVLFVAALFVKGVTHELFLEAGVFLVSVKIIIMAYKNSVAIAGLDEKLDRLLRAVPERDSGGEPGGRTAR